MNRTLLAPTTASLIGHWLLTFIDLKHPSTLHCYTPCWLIKSSQRSTWSPRASRYRVQSSARNEHLRGEKLHRLLMVYSTKYLVFYIFLNKLFLKGPNIVSVSCIMHRGSPTTWIPALRHSSKQRLRPFWNHFFLKPVSIWKKVNFKWWIWGSISLCIYSKLTRELNYSDIQSSKDIISQVL